MDCGILVKGLVIVRGGAPSSIHLSRNILTGFDRGHRLAYISPHRY